MPTMNPKTWALKGLVQLLCGCAGRVQSYDAIHLRDLPIALLDDFQRDDCRRSRYHCNLYRLNGCCEGCVEAKSMIFLDRSKARPFKQHHNFIDCLLCRQGIS